MSQRLLERIFWDITDPEIGHHFFFSRPDATGVLGPSSLQKVCAAIRQLAYGTTSDHVEEYTGVADSSSGNMDRNIWEHGKNEISRRK